MLFKGFKFGMLLQFAIGPVFVFILQTAFVSGFKSAEMGVLGVTLVDALFIIAAISGLGIVLDKSEGAKNVIKYFGAFVLIIFGLSNILGVFGFSLLPSLNFISNDDYQNNTFLKALILTLSNPLTIIFWVGVFSTRITQDNLSKSHMYSFGAGAVLSTLLFLSLIALLGSFVNDFLSEDIVQILNFAVGLILCLFGIKTMFKKS